MASPFTFLTPILSYDANDVFLNLMRNSTAFTDVAHTPNQTAVAGALDQIPPGNPLVAALAMQTIGGAQQAFDALSGEIHASVGGLLADESHYVRYAILSRLIQAYFAGGPNSFAPFGTTGPAVAMLGGEPSMGLGMGEGRGVTPAPGYGLTFWTEGFGSWGDFKTDGNAATVNRTLGGFVSGVDAGLGDGWRSGFAVGYTRSNEDANARLSSADIDSYHLAGYAGGPLGPFALRSGGIWTFHNIDTSRTVVFPGFFDRTKASYDGDTGQLFGELALPFVTKSTAVEPFAGLAYVHVNTTASRRAAAPQP